MNKKIVVLGSKGCLGQQIIETLKNNSNKLITISRKNFDYIYNYKKIFNIIKKFKPRIIINCAAITKIDKCEKNPDEAYEVNAFFPYRLSIISHNIGAIFIHFSTDAVFDGNKKSSYTIDDIPLPKTVYGKSKLLGEKYISYYEKSLIIRLPMLYGKFHQNQIIGNLTNKLCKNKKIFVAKDLYCTPTNSKDIAIFIKQNIENKKINRLIKKKILHLSSNRRLSIFNFMKKISNIIGKSQNIVAVKNSFFEGKSIRPKNLGLKSSVKYFKNSSLNTFLYTIKKTTSSK